MKIDTKLALELKIVSELFGRDQAARMLKEALETRNNKSDKDTKKESK